MGLFSLGDVHVSSRSVFVHDCRFCKMGLFFCCDTTNPSKEVETLYGARPSGMHGARKFVTNPVRHRVYAAGRQIDSAAGS